MRGQNHQALQILSSEGQVGLVAKGGCVVEDGDDGLMEELVVVFGRLFMHEGPMVVWTPRQWKTLNVEVSAWFYLRGVGQKA